MENNHKGSEFNNIIETWEQNERLRESEKSAGAEASKASEPAAAGELGEVIKREAAEYDNENKEERVLSGDRATVNDDQEDGSNDK